MKGKHIGLFIILILISFSVVAQHEESKKSKPSKVQKEAAKKQEAQKRKAEKARSEGLKRHRSIQSKEVRKRMKRNEKHRYQHVDSFDDKPNFFRKIFPRRRPTGT
jgi:hypothetical protein